MSSRNATREDFLYVMDLLRNKQINAQDFISHHVAWAEVDEVFPKIHLPEMGVIKALISR
jgi:threonine dehydrogenase-like Zn-dependent dehydrogenase